MEVASPLCVHSQAWPYLVAQRGALDDMREDRERWLVLYAERLIDEYRRMRAELPRECSNILDVGGGMGGIDVLLNRHYGGGCAVTILDGVDDPPQMTRHSQTFANRDIARLFLNINGIKRVHWIDAANPPAIAPRFWDLVVSQQSWGFHYPPSKYLPMVQSGCLPGTRLVIDVRLDKPEWLAQLSNAFRCISRPCVAKKYATLIFEHGDHAPT